jgi:hypothetical protein
MSKLAITVLTFAALMSAQEPANRPAEVVTLDRTPVYKVTVVSRTAKAVNYRHRSGATKVDFQGTSLMPGAEGEAKVESKKGYI